MEAFLDGRVAVVTGGMRGIGLAIAQARGARVAVWDYDVREDDIARAGFRPALVQRVDVSSWAEVEAAFAAAVTTFRQVDILVNNAGINGPVVPSWKYPLEAWEKVIAVDLNSVFYGCRAAIPHMRERRYGRIVNVGRVRAQYCLRAGEPSPPHRDEGHVVRAWLIAVRPYPSRRRSTPAFAMPTCSADGNRCQLRVKTRRIVGLRIRSAPLPKGDEHRNGSCQEHRR